MPTLYADLKITVAPIAVAKGMGSSAREELLESPDIRKSADRDAVSASISRELTPEANRRRNEVVALYKGYAALEEEADQLLEDIAERCSDIVYTFDPDKKPELMHLLGKLFGISEPKIDMNIYLKLVDLMAKAGVAYSNKAQPEVKS